MSIAQHAPSPLSRQLLIDINASFMSGLHVASLVAAGVCWLGAVVALKLPGRPGVVASDPQPAEVTLAPATV
jgi:hypothetical protein